MSFPRYERYKDSGVEWLDAVPEHWLLKRLILLASINDDALAEDTNLDFEMAYVDISSVTPGSKILAAESMKFGGAPSRARRIAKNGDILVSTVRTYLRAIAPVIDPPENLIASTGFAVIRPRAYCSSVFLNYALQAASFIEEVIARSTGVSYPAINAHDLSFIKLPLPPSKQDQDRIGLFLETETAKMDALIEEQRRFIELLKEKRQAIISHAVTKGLNPSIPLKDAGVDWIGLIPQQWEVSKLGQLANIVRGGSPRPAGDSRFFNGDFIPWITVGEVTKDDGMYLVATESMLTQEGAALSRTIDSGTLVLTNSGATLGVPKILEITGCANDGILAFLNLHMNANKKYLYFVLSLLTTELRDRMKQGSGQPNLNTGIVSALQVPLPPVIEQLAIVAELERMQDEFGALMAQAEISVTLLQERRSALVSAAVTGKIDVRSYNPKEAA